MPLPTKVCAVPQPGDEKPARRTKLTTKTFDPAFHCAGSETQASTTSTSGRGGSTVEQPASERESSTASSAPEAGVALLVEAVLAGCQSALAVEVGTATGFPTDAVRCLAEAVQHVRTEAWAAGHANGAAASAQALAPLARLQAVLPGVFVALSGEPAAESSPKSSPELACTEADVEAGMWLAAVHFDAAAVHGPLPADTDDGLTDLVLRFLAQHGRACLRAASRAATGEPKDAAPTPGGGLAKPFAAALRAVHHALAAARYMPMPATHRVVPLVVRCLTSSQLLEHLPGAAADLLQAVLGQADQQSQALALEQLISACGSSHGSSSTSGKRPRGRKHARQALSSYTSAVLRAICAACVPGNGEATAPSPDESKEGEGAMELAMDHRKRAESRSATFIDGVIRKCLLGVRERERDPDAWAWLELFLTELLEVSVDLQWVAAPMIVLFLTKALVRVAGAPRSVDLAWTQRDFAVKLLGNVAAVLVREHASTRDASHEADVAELRCWAAAAKPGTFEAEVPTKDCSDEAQRLLLQFVSAAPAAANQALLPPAVGFGGTCGGKAEVPSLKSAVIPAGHKAYSRSFLLCSWANSQPAGGQHEARSKKARKKVQRADADLSSGGASASDQLLAEWTVAVASDAKAEKPGQKSARAHSSVLQSAARLYKHTLHQDGTSMIARARGVALEALLAQIKSSPFAFVRRTAVSGLLAACKADIQLAASRSVAEAVAVGLQDESACVRVAFIDLIDYLLDSKSTLLTPEVVAECRAAIHVRLADASFLVRRAAFRVACKALQAGDVQLVGNAADLLRRIQHEPQQVRDSVLTSVENALLAPPLTKVVLERLVGIASEPGINSTTLRNLLRAHKTALEPQVYEASMRTLVVDAVKCISDVLSDGDVTPWTLILEQIGVEHPAAVHSHIWQLREWLSMESTNAANAGILALQACRVLSDVLPSWATQVDACDRKEVSQHLQDALTPLLQERGSRLTRAAAECLCAVAVHVSQDGAHALGLYRESFRQLASAVESGAPVDGEGQRLLGRHAWILGTVLEFLDIDAIQKQGGVQEAIMEVSSTCDSVDSAVQTLCLLAMGGPMPLRPSLVPCIGFLLRRHSRFLRTASAGMGGPLEVLRVGLVGSPCAATGAAMLGQTTESLAALLDAYEAAAQAQSPATGNGVDWGSTVAQCMKLGAVSEAVQRLATLQPEMLAVLGAAREPSVARHIVAALRSMSVLGVLHPSSAMPALLAAGLAGPRAVSDPARRLVLRLLEGSPRLLAGRFGAGLRRAAERLLRDGACHGGLIAEKWRFKSICEAYSEGLESRPARERFIDVVVDEFEALACIPGHGSPEVGAQSSAIVAHQQPAASGEAMHGELKHTPAHVLMCGELLVGILSAVPYHGELEFASVLLKAARFLTLRCLPLLAEGGQGGPRAGRSVFGTCVAATLLQALCSHLVPGAGEVERLVAARVAEADGQGAEDQQLPASFWRKPPLHLTDLLLELAEVATNDEGLLDLMQRCVPMDSPLLRGADGSGLGAGSRGAQARRRGKRAAGADDDKLRKAQRRGKAAARRGSGGGGVPAGDVGEEPTAADEE